MGKEIERKFLVSDGSYVGMAEKCVSIKQGYISRDPERTVRVRVCDKSAFLTIKGITRGATREEFEYEIPYSDALRLLKLCDGRVIEKRRYIVPYAGFIWEVDKFEGDFSPLVVAEIELPSETASFELPPFAGSEVTGDPAYYNSNL